MEKMTAQRVVDIVESNYCFSDGQREKWLEVRNRILSEEKESGVNSEYERIDRALCLLGDSHLRLFSTRTSEYMIAEVFEWELGRLYHCLFSENRRTEVLAINNISINSLYEEKRNQYPCMSAGFIENELLLDIKSCRGRFGSEALVLKYREETNTFTVNPKSITELRTMVANTAYRPSPIIVKKVDDNTAMVKIVTFGSHELLPTLIYHITRLDEKIENVILDVRGNTGGYIKEAEDIVSTIVTHDVEYNYYVSSRENAREERYVKSQQHLFFQNKHLCILMDKYTASCAEYVFISGIINDHPNIKMIGSETSGSSGQAKHFPITSEAILMVTVRKYYDKLTGNELKCGFVPDYMITKDMRMIHYESEDPDILWICKHKNLVFESETES